MLPLEDTVVVLSLVYIRLYYIKVQIATEQKSEKSITWEEIYGDIHIAQ